ncbi:MAG: hypothetical protein SGPRY_002173 [Prymnesium sp.]
MARKQEAEAAIDSAYACYLQERIANEALESESERLENDYLRVLSRHSRQYFGDENLPVVKVCGKRSFSSSQGSVPAKWQHAVVAGQSQKISACLPQVLSLAHRS